MRSLVRVFVAVALLSAVPGMPAQQPEIVHAQLSTQNGGQGLKAILSHRTDSPVWVGYTVPVNEFSSGWGESRVSYLEGYGASNTSYTGGGNRSFDHAVILLRVEDGG